MDDEKLQVDQPDSLALNPRGSPFRYRDAVEVLQEEPPHLLDYLAIVRKRRWVVLSCLLIVFGTVAIGTLKQRRVYRATVLIEVNPEPSDVLNLKEVLQAASPTDAETYRATQVKVLESRSLAEHVVQKLQLQRIPEFLRRQLVFGLFELNSKIPPPPRNRPSDTSSDPYRAAVQHFLDSVEVKPVLHTSIIGVSFHSNDPTLAARVANELAEQYIYQNLQAKWDETLKSAEWLSDRLGELRAKMEKADDALQAYARANSIIFVAERQNLISLRLEQLQAEYTRAQTVRFQKESLARIAEAGTVEELPGFISDKMVQDLESRLMDLQREYAKVTTSVKPEHPRALQLQREINSVSSSLDLMKKLISKDIINGYQAARAHEESLAQAMQQQKDELNAMQERLIQYNILKRESDSDRQLYDALLQRLKESQVQAGMKASNIRVVDSAQVPPAPIIPRVAMNLTLGLVWGLMFGIGLAFFLEYLDKSVKTSDDVEKRLRLPSLAVLPAFSLDGAGKEAEMKLVSADAESNQLVQSGIQTGPATLEAFRSLRTSILLSADPVPKTILIASALPGEGKTTITVNLGATLASLGSRVLIVDCDMRRPNCHRLTRVKNEPGFVRCLTGQVGLEEAVLSVPGVANLSVIPCGPVPPNPAEVLASARAIELFQSLRSQFEYVLVDSPPLLSVSDGRILSTMTDAVVLVVHAYSTPYQVIRQARTLVYSAGARILGVALNNVDLRRDGYSYGYYKYGYGYGYGYADQDSQTEDIKSEG